MCFLAISTNPAGLLRACVSGDGVRGPEGGTKTHACLSPPGVHPGRRSSPAFPFLPAPPGTQFLPGSGTRGARLGPLQVTGRGVPCGRRTPQRAGQGRVMWTMGRVTDWSAAGGQTR